MPVRNPVLGGTFFCGIPADGQPDAWAFSAGHGAQCICFCGKRHSLCFPEETRRKLKLSLYDVTISICREEK